MVASFAFFVTGETLFWSSTMASFKLTAEMRDDLGKGASRRLRREHKIPAVLYGAGRPAWSMTLNEFEFNRNLQEEAFYSAIIELTLDGKPQKVFLRDLQRHPAKPLVLHADFMRVRDDVEMVLTVPVHLVNEEASVGIKAGGLLMRNMVDIEIACLPANLPEYIEIDIADLEVGESLHMSDLKLPEGVVSVILAHAEQEAADDSDFDIHSVDQTVVSIVAPKAASTEEETEGAAATDDAPAEGDESSED